MAYESYLVEVPDIGEALGEINKAGKELISITHISDSAQLLLVVEDRKQGSVLRPVGRKESEEGEED